MFLIALIFFSFFALGIRRHNGPFFLYLYSSGILFFGYFSFSLAEIDQYLLTYLLCNFVLLLGLLLTIDHPARLSINRFDYIPNKYGFIATFWTVFAVICLHYAIVGIPVLSENIDELRFTSSSSGFFGIPSRFSAYMPSLLFISYSVYKPYIRISSLQSLAMFIAVLFCFFVQGHKSSVLQLLFLAILVGPFTKDAIKNMQFRRKDIFYILAISIGFALFSFYQFESLSNFSLLEYILLRYTVILHDSGVYLLSTDYSSYTFWGGNAFLNDLFYPILQVFGLDAITLNTQLSRNMYSVADDSFTVPVTPGFYAYHAFLVGPYVTVFIAFLYGIITGKLFQRAFVTPRPMISVINLFLVYWIWIGYGSGNAYYLVFNVLFSGILFSILYYVFCLFFQTLRKPRI